MGVFITFCRKLKGIYKWALLTGSSPGPIIWLFFLTGGLWRDFTAWKWNTCTYVLQQSKAKCCLAWIYCVVPWDSSGFWNCSCKGKWGQVKGNKKQNLCYRARHKLSKYLYKDYLLLHQLSSCLPGDNFCINLGLIHVQVIYFLIKILFCTACHQMTHKNPQVHLSSTHHL